MHSFDCANLEKSVNVHERSTSHPASRYFVIIQARGPYFERWRRDVGDGAARVESWSLLQLFFFYSSYGGPDQENLPYIKLAGKANFMPLVGSCDLWEGGTDLDIALFFRCLYPDLIPLLVFR